MHPATESGRDAWIEVDLDAIGHNVERLCARAFPSEVCAVVKADGYGHGAVPVARRALDAGATWLAVAIVDEGIELRSAGIRAPILVLSQPPLGMLRAVVEADLTPSVYTAAFLDAAEVAAVESDRRLGVHLWVDTGMRRVGVPPEAAVDLARRIVDADHLRLAGLATHLAVADELDNPFTAQQFARFEAVRRSLTDAGIEPGVVHVANSAATLRGLGGDTWVAPGPASVEADAEPGHGSPGTIQPTMVRCGIAVYGLEPAAEFVEMFDHARDDEERFERALSLHARVSFVKRVAAGEGLSYGLHHRCETDSWIATVPLGYADGVRRDLSARGGQVLIGGVRRRMIGTVTMDQFLVDCGPDTPPEVGDEVVLIGRQGDEEITAFEWATKLDTITYEVVCGFGARLSRIHRTEPQKSR